MSDELIVYKARTNIITVSLGIDVSADLLTSEIRTQSGELIAQWEVTFDNDGKDGELILRLDDSATSGIQYDKGIMDIKRVTGGEPVPVFESPIEVVFRESVTQ